MVAAELVELIDRDARALRQELRLPVEEAREEVPELSDKDREAIREAMGQADLYLQQGLVRVARRLLENLRFRYPEDPQIARKIAVIDEVRTHLDEDEIRRRVEKTTVLEAEYKERVSGKKAEDKKAPETPGEKTEEPSPSEKAGQKAVEEAPQKPQEAAPKADEVKPEPKPKARPAGPFKAEILEGEKVSTADIFGETDIIPFAGADTGERAFYELGDAAASELRWLSALRERQLHGDEARLERELTEIVSGFRRGLKADGGEIDAETHYQLGIAFLGQGLMAEAVDEMTEAAKDPAHAAMSYSALAEAYKQRGDTAESEKWSNRVGPQK